MVIKLSRIILEIKRVAGKGGVRVAVVLKSILVVHLTHKIVIDV